MLLTTRLFIAAASLCGASWLLKTAAIATTGGTQTDGGLVGVLWALGMLGMVLAAGTGVAALLAGRWTWLRVVAGMVAAVLAFVVLTVVDDVLKTLYPGNGWFRDELGLVVVGTLLAAAALLVAARARQSDPSLS
jgi:hypothetical protein